MTAAPTVAAGIAFPATANPQAGVNVLDDYQEGTLTPALAGAGGASGQTYGTQSGLYVKIGKLVHFEIVIILTAKGTLTGDLIVTGLPVAAAGHCNVTAHWDSIVAAAVLTTPAFVESGTTQIRLYQLSAAGASSFGAPMVTADIDNDSQVYISGMYIATE